MPLLSCFDFDFLLLKLHFFPSSPSSSFSPSFYTFFFLLLHLLLLLLLLLFLLKLNSRQAIKFFWDQLFEYLLWLFFSLTFSYPPFQGNIYRSLIHQFSSSFFWHLPIFFCFLFYRQFCISPNNFCWTNLIVPFSNFLHTFFLNVTNIILLWRNDVFIIAIIAIFSLSSGYFTVLIYEFASQEENRSKQIQATRALNLSFQVKWIFIDKTLW